MTDEQLITMLYESSPAELSAAQLKMLRTRMLASAKVKRAVAQRVRLEQGLTETLGRPHLQTAAIVAACTAAAVSVPLASGLLSWIKGWSLTVWSGVAAVTVSVPVAVVVMVSNAPVDKPLPVVAPPVAKEGIAGIESNLPPGEDVKTPEESPSDNLPPGWVPYSGDASPEDTTADGSDSGDVDSGGDPGSGDH